MLVTSVSTPRVFRIITENLIGLLKFGLLWIEETVYAFVWVGSFVVVMPYLNGERDYYYLLGWSLFSLFVSAMIALLTAAGAEEFSQRKSILRWNPITFLPKIAIGSYRLVQRRFDRR